MHGVYVGQVGARLDCVYDVCVCVCVRVCGKTGGCYIKKAFK